MDEHEEAIAYDCIKMGLRLRNLGTDEFSWGDLLVIVKHAPRDSAIYRATHPDDEVEWGLQEQLTALAVDYLAVSNWQRSQGKKKDYPKPIPRPGIKEEEKIGKGALTMDEMAEWLSTPREGGNAKKIIVGGEHRGN